MTLSFLANVRAGGSGGELEHAAVARNFPAVIETAQTARLVSSVGQRGPAMRTELVDQAQLAIAGTEQHEPFA